MLSISPLPTYPRGYQQVNLPAPGTDIIQNECTYTYTKLFARHKVHSLAAVSKSHTQPSPGPPFQIYSHTHTHTHNPTTYAMTDIIPLTHHHIQISRSSSTLHPKIPDKMNTSTTLCLPTPASSFHLHPLHTFTNILPPCIPPFYFTRHESTAKQHHVKYRYSTGLYFWEQKTCEIEFFFFFSFLKLYVN